MIHKFAAGEASRDAYICTCGVAFGVRGQAIDHFRDSNRAEFDRLAVELAKGIERYSFSDGELFAKARELLAAAEAVKVINAQ